MVRDFELGLKKLFKEAYPTEDADGSSAYLSRFITGLSPSIAREFLLRGTPDNIEDAVKKALEVDRERVMHYVEKQETEMRKKKAQEQFKSGTCSRSNSTDGNATANVVIVEETARIPSCSSCIVSATVQNGDALSGRVGILEPHNNIPSSLLVARSLNTVSKANVIVIQVTNTGHSETTLYKGTQIGIFSIEHCVMALDSESAGPVLDDKMLEIDLSNTDLTTEQSVELQKLISRYLCKCRRIFREDFRDKAFNSNIWATNDIAVFGGSFQQHLERLKTVFLHLKKAGMKLKPISTEQVLQGVEYVDYLKKRFQLVHQYVRQNAQKGMQRQKTGYDQKENTRKVSQISSTMARTASPHGEQESSEEEEEKGTPSEEQESRGEEINKEPQESMADLQDEHYIYVETRRPEPGPAVEEHLPPPPLIAPAPRQPPQPPAEP
eukprot:Em0017g378a